MIHSGGADAEGAAQGRIKGQQPVAVLDIGSNSVRLIVYERHARALTPLYNEKSPCALGRGVAATGRLADENVAEALDAMRRFSLVVKLMKVGQLHILATSAVREAENGPLFSAEVARITGEKVRILTGAEEAHFAALGVAAGMPEFGGVVGDLGGGSLELSSLSGGSDTGGETFQLGVIRLQDESEGCPKIAQKIARDRLENSAILKLPEGQTFCAIGGTWRALAKLHQRKSGYPLHMVQDYEVDASDLFILCDKIVDGFEGEGSYPGAELVSSSRRSLLPFGAAALKEVLRAGGYEKVRFSVLGVREGFLFDLLDPAEQQKDPLIQACNDMSVLRSRSPVHSHELIGFSEQFVAASGLLETSNERQLREAACLLADIGWRGHPDYRGEQSVDLVAYGALIGVDHPGRAFLAETLAVRYMGLKHKSVSEDLLDLAGKMANARARILGALFRLAFPMSAGMSGVLPKVRFSCAAATLTLNLIPELEFLDGHRLRNRLNQLANVAGFEKSDVRIL